MSRELSQELAGIRYWESAEVGAAVANPLVHDLRRYWEEKRGTGRLPAKRDFDPLDHPRAFGLLMVLERLEDGDYLYRLHGLKAAEMVGRDYTGHRVRAVAGDATPFFIEKYDQCIHAAQPYYLLHKAVTPKTVAVMERLLMPFTDDEGDPRFVIAYTAPLTMTGVVPLGRTSRMS